MYSCPVASSCHRVAAVPIGMSGTFFILSLKTATLAVLPSPPTKRKLEPATHVSGCESNSHRDTPEGLSPIRDTDPVWKKCSKLAVRASSEKGLTFEEFNSYVEEITGYSPPTTKEKPNAKMKFPPTKQCEMFALADAQKGKTEEEQKSLPNLYMLSKVLYSKR